MKKCKQWETDSDKHIQSVGEVWTLWLLSGSSDAMQRTPHVSAIVIRILRSRHVPESRDKIVCNGFAHVFIVNQVLRKLVLQAVCQCMEPCMDNAIRSGPRFYRCQGLTNYRLATLLMIDFKCRPVWSSVSENGENGLADELADGGNALPSPRIFGLEPPLVIIIIIIMLRRKIACCWEACWLATSAVCDAGDEQYSTYRVAPAAGACHGDTLLFHPSRNIT